MTVPFPMPGHPDDQLFYVPRAEVVRACASVDIIAVVAAALRHHAAGATLLPDEAYLGWPAPDGAAARCLAMPGGVPTGDGTSDGTGDGTGGGLSLGLKVINGCLSNPQRGLARAQGLILLFDPQTAWPRAMLEAAHISALRTAAVSAITAQHLGRPGLASMAVIGCGALARAHLQLLPSALPGLDRVSLYDTDPLRSRRLAEDLRAQDAGARLRVTESTEPRECVRDADLIVTTTTTTTGYLSYDWLRRGALIAHVSLDDVLPEVVHRADLLVVDDWELVGTDTRRLVGRLYHAGRLRSPDGRYHPASTPDPSARAVDTTLGRLLTGDHPGRRTPDDIVLSNPFGMSILDIAVAHAVLPAAIRGGARRLPR
jgi:ornithine cyclodeaminase/alanine dehydrogenase-like protein (mu-crystallin family)